MARILVVDDEHSMREFLEIMLTKEGYQVGTAAGGVEAINLLEGETYELVITDIRMPGIDGNGVVAHIRKSDKKPIPVIAISGTPWMLEQNAFDVVLPKPFPLQDLVESIQHLVPAAPQIATGS